MDGEVVHPLLSLLNECFAEHLPCEVFCDPAHLTNNKTNHTVVCSTWIRSLESGACRKYYWRARPASHACVYRGVAKFLPIFSNKRVDRYQVLVPLALAKKTLVVRDSG